MNILLCVYQQKIYTMKINEKAVYIYIYHRKIVFGHFPVAFFIDLNRKKYCKNNGRLLLNLDDSW